MPGAPGSSRALRTVSTATSHLLSIAETTLAQELPKLRDVGSIMRGFAGCVHEVAPSENSFSRRIAFICWRIIGRFLARSQLKSIVSMRIVEDLPL
jgi:hypothetical protein